MIPPLHVDSQATLRDALHHLQGASIFYLDTEFDSTRDGATLCLLQLSDGNRIFLLDPFAVDLAPLAQALGAPGVEWVLHAGRQDVALLCSQLRIQAPSLLFDTQIGWALQSPESGVALAYLEFLVLGVQPAKGHQMDDWRKRPLNASQLAYAARDVAHLPALRSALASRLGVLGRSALVYPASHEALLPPAEPAAPLSLASFRNAWQLDPPAQAALRGIIAWSNGLPPAAAALLPEGKVLLAIAARRPDTLDELGRIKGVHRRLVNERGAELLRVLELSRCEDPSRPFVPLIPPPYATHDEHCARARLDLLRAHASRLLDVAPELLLPSRLLERLRPILVATGDLTALLPHIKGFRRVLLEPVWQEAINAC